MSHFKASFSGRTLFPVLMLSLAPLCLAQVQPIQPDFEHKKEAATTEAKPRGVGQLHRDFGFPGAIRPWERGMYLNPRRSTYGYSYPSVYGPYYDSYYGGAYGGYYRPYGLRPQHNRVYRESYGPPYAAYSLPLDHAYDLGVAPPEIQDTIAAQAERALTDYQSAMDAGYDAFRAAQYRQATRYFLFASQLNHGDPSSRLCAAHAQVATGQFASAAGLVHRAIDLQPRLVYLPLDIRDAYGRPSDFPKHLEALRDAASHSRDADLWFLLGYYYYNSGQGDLAASALNMARQLSPQDRVLGRFAAAASGVEP